MKGTAHPSQDELRLGRGGPVGDRDLCLIDLEARAVLRTVAHPALVTVTARWVGTRLQITTPDGAVVIDEPQPVGERVEVDYWGRPELVEVVHGAWTPVVQRLVGTPAVVARVVRPGGVVYGGAVSVVTTGALHELARRAGVDHVDPRRLRATVVVDAPAEAEREWLGADLAIGETVVRVGSAISRCAVIDIDPDTGARGSGLLQALARWRPSPAGPVLGVAADVICGGWLRPGDLVAPVGRGGH